MTTATCNNCQHSDLDDMYPRCARTGKFCNNEMEYGGRCAGPPDGIPEMNLWEQRKPRKGLFRRTVILLKKLY